MIKIVIGERQGRRAIELSKQEAIDVEEALHKAIWFGQAPHVTVEGIDVFGPGQKPIEVVVVPPDYHEHDNAAV